MHWILRVTRLGSSHGHFPSRHFLIKRDFSMLGYPEWSVGDFWNFPGLNVFTYRFRNERVFHVLQWFSEENYERYLSVWRQTFRKSKIVSNKSLFFNLKVIFLRFSIFWGSNMKFTAHFWCISMRFSLLTVRKYTLKFPYIGYSKRLFEEEQDVAATLAASVFPASRSFRFCSSIIDSEYFGSQINGFRDLRARTLFVRSTTLQMFQKSTFLEQKLMFFGPKKLFFFVF